MCTNRDGGFVEVFTPAMRKLLICLSSGIKLALSPHVAKDMLYGYPKPQLTPDPRTTALPPWEETSEDLERRKKMSKIREALVRLHREDSGQDLIEYALIAALIALAATFGMGSVAKAINDAFSSIGAKLGAYTG